MKKINLRLLSMMLGVITLFPGAPVRGESCFEDVKNKIGNIPFGVKVAVGVGVASVLTSSAITAGYALAKSKSSSSDQKDNDRQTSSPRDHQRQALPISVCGYGSGSYPNANFYNTSNLCYWHALLQHLYDIKAFKKFIEEYDENLITDGRTKEKFLVLREIFNAMGERIGGVFSQSECEKFAESFFGKQNDAKGNRVLGAQQDFGEVCTNFMSDILDLYTKKYGCILTDYNGSSERTSNILTDSVKLEQGKELKLDDLLRENSPNRSDRFKAIDKYCWSNEESRLSILRRLPISCLFIRKEDDGILVSENGEFILDTDVIKGLFGEEVSEANSRSSCVAKKFSELPTAIKNPVVNDFDQDPKQSPILSNEKLLKTTEEDWNSEDSNKKKAARLRIFSSAPISDFIVKDEQSGKWGIDTAKLRKLVNGKKSFEDAIKCLKNLEQAKTKCVKDALDTCDLPYIRVPVIDDQFSIFISRLGFNAEANVAIKDDRPVDLGNGTVEFKGQKFELTAVTVHSTRGTGGHYYTYKKQGGIWWKYDDLSRGAPACEVFWNDIENDFKCNCVMMTFSKQGTNVVGNSPETKAIVKRCGDEIATVGIADAGGLEISGLIQLLSIENRKVAVVNCKGVPFSYVAGRMVLSSRELGEVATVSVSDNGLVLRSKEHLVVVDNLVLLNDKFREATIIGVANKDRLPLCDVILNLLPHKGCEDKIATVSIANAGGLKLVINGFIHLLDIGNRKVAVASVVNAGGLGGRGDTPYPNGIAGQMVLFDGKSGKITAAGAVICEGNPLPYIADPMVLSSGKIGEVATVSVSDNGFVLGSKEHPVVVDNLVLLNDKFREATIIGVANKDRLPLCDVILQSSPQNPTQNLYFSGCRFTSTTIGGDTHYPSFAVDQKLLFKREFGETDSASAVNTDGSLRCGFIFKMLLPVLVLILTLVKARW